MKIDHNQKYGLLNFRAKKESGKVTMSDHHPVILTLDLSIPKEKPIRRSFLNFRNTEGQMMFHNMTKNKSELSEIFSTPVTFQSQVKVWERKFKSCVFKSFPKICHRRRKFRVDEVGHLIEKQKKLRLDPATAQNEKEIDKIEEQIVQKTEMKYSQLVKETIGEITGENGKINSNGL